jgi:hypothetical protein
MLRKTYFAVSALISGFGFCAIAQNSSPIVGQWTVAGPWVQDKVQLTIQRNAGIGSSMSSSSPVPLSDLRGLTRAQMDSSGSMARFELARDAGTFHFDGYVQNGGGGGVFTFVPNPKFVSEMRSLGFSGLSDEKVFTMAAHDVSAAYVRDMNALGVRPESTDQLITLRIHNVTVQYVKDFKSLGYADLSPDKLVTMRIHGVTADFAGELKTLGYNAVSTDQMVTMRIHDASADFIKEVAALGYNHPSIDQLVTMRIHGVTPDFIRKARSRVGNLSIDQLVSLKIHGILD